MNVNKLPTTKEIIKLLPFEEAYKVELLQKFDTASADEKFTLEGMLWKAYREWYRMQKDKQYQIALSDVMEGKEHFDAEFYKRLEEKTNKEIQTEGTQTKEKVDLTSARSAMEKIVREIQAAKKKPTKN